MWTDLISVAILQLQEKGDLQELYMKWWEKEGIDPGKHCESNEDKKKDSASELDWDTIGGIFVVMFGGLLLAIFVSIFEYIWRTKKLMSEEEEQVCQINILLNLNFMPI